MIKLQKQTQDDLQSHAFKTCPENSNAGGSANYDSQESISHQNYHSSNILYVLALHFTEQRIIFCFRNTQDTNQPPTNRKESYIIRTRRRNDQEIYATIVRRKELKRKTAKKLTKDTSENQIDMVTDNCEIQHGELSGRDRIETTTRKAGIDSTSQGSIKRGAEIHACDFYAKWKKRTSVTNIPNSVSIYDGNTDDLVSNSSKDSDLLGASL